MASYFTHKKTSFLLVNLVGNVFIVLSYVFLDSMVGLIGISISCLRGILFLIYEQKKKQPPLIWMLVLLGLIIANGVFFYETTIDILYIVALCLLVVAFAIKNVLALKMFIIIPLVMILIFNLQVGAYVNSVTNALEIFCAFLVTSYGAFGSSIQRMYGDRLLSFNARSPQRKNIKLRNIIKNR
ncbi:MAG: YgjV family protein [Firmicutes bacterium]|nr:YgjV family protein [Bacillota bacterium]